jgi:hypothetical protein
MVNSDHQCLLQVPSEHTHWRLSGACWLLAATVIAVGREETLRGPLPVVMLPFWYVLDTDAQAITHPFPPPLLLTTHLVT